MEEEKNLQSETTQETGSELSKKTVGFPELKKDRGNLAKVLFLIIVGILILVVGINLLKTKGVKLSLSPTPTLQPTPSPYFVASPTPTVEVSRERIRIQVLNGTNIPQQAAKVKGELERLGYSDIEIGNAESQNYTITQVTFSPDVHQLLKDEILQKLESLYAEVKVNTSAIRGFDIQIITGYPKGYSTPTPTTLASPTPTESMESNTSTPTPSPSQ